MAVNKEFNVSDKQVGKTVQRSFRIKLEQFKFTSEGKDITGAMQWNEAQDVVAFNSIDVLPPKKEIKGVVEVSFEENKNGAWTQVLFEGKRVTEKLETTFNTGTAPDYIPHSNIEYTYPVIGQLNYYKDETREGYIKLRQGQPYLFEPGAEWNQVGRFTSTSGKKSDFGFAYNSGLITFATPNDLQTNQIYAFELLNVPKQASGAIDRNVTAQKTNLVVAGENTNTEIKTKKAEGNLTELEEKAIFTANFKTSKHASVSEKFSNIIVSAGWTWALYPSVIELGTTVEGEGFDRFEFVDSDYSKNPLLQFEADLTNNAWYENSVFPLIYQDYPINGAIRLTRRPPDYLNVPPVRSIYLRQIPNDVWLSPEAAMNGSFSWPTNRAAVIYNLPLEIYRDYLDLQASCANLSISKSSSRTDKLLITPYPALPQGTYKVKIKYQLPGINKVTSEKIVTINYSIGFVR